jgi:4'-phosphopantetheinyl transferase
MTGTSRNNADAVHIWTASLHVTDSVLSTYDRLLSCDEKERAERYVFQKDRDRFISRRGILRILLGNYTGKAPEEIRFLYNKYGKPSLDDGNGSKEIFCFNGSVSEMWVMYAFSRTLSLGIDIEQEKRNIDFDSIASRFFSLSEIETFFSLKEKARIEAFYNCWTRKEAFLKAKGTGITLGLDQFDVSLEPQNPPLLLRTKFCPEEAARWTLFDLESEPGDKASLAVLGDNIRLTYFSWPREGTFPKL